MRAAAARKKQEAGEKRHKAIGGRGRIDKRYKGENGFSRTRVFECSSFDNFCC
jgi:hypothetical protein